MTPKMFSRVTLAKKGEYNKKEDLADGAAMMTIYLGKMCYKQEAIDSAQIVLSGWGISPDIFVVIEVE